jgi:hypothetical protein
LVLPVIDNDALSFNIIAQRKLPLVTVTSPISLADDDPDTIRVGIKALLAIVPITPLPLVVVVSVIPLFR